MTTQFDIKRLLEVALADEQGGMALYDAMSQKASNEKLKTVFSRLSQTEKAHAGQFEQMIAALKNDSPMGAYPDEYAEYLDGLCAKGGDSDAFAQISGTQTDNELIDLALKFENAQLNIQKDIGDALGGAHKITVDIILAEEQAHVELLSRTKQKLGL